MYGRGGCHAPGSRRHHGGVTHQRAQLGLVLGGTGVRGLSGAGALGALDRAGLSPDVLVGVSTAAVVAAAYAARTDWSDGLRAMDRSRLPSTAGVADDETFARLRGALRSARQLAPSVWTWGRQGYESFGRRSLDSLLGASLTFDETRIPLALVATDLGEGARAILDHGLVAEAALASSALPGVTRPIWRGEHLLVDGAFSDPAPVDVARDLGADVVVVVAPAGPSLVGADEPEGPVSGLLRGIELGQRAFVEERLSDADVALRPDLGPDVRVLDFSSLDEAARRAGADATVAAPQISAMLAAHQRQAVGRRRG